VLFAVDNTLLSPWLQNPLELGADLVVHSATKLLAGHGDATAGALVVRDEALAQELAFLRNAEGNALAPFESWLVLRGMKTLGLRVERAQENAARVAQLLARSAFVKRVHYPGLAADPGRAVLARQARGAGQVLSFEAGSYEDARAFVEALELFTIAVSFGCVSSQASLPGRMSHASIPPAQRAQNPLPEGLVRLSIGIEDGGDLCADVERAFARVRAAPQRHERAVPERS
jgi:cystathionine beta-lyase/cystathionine gamma-synthase